MNVKEDDLVKLWSRHHDAVRRTCFLLAQGDSYLRDELVQEAMVALWRALVKEDGRVVRDKKQESAWVYAVTRNAAIDYLRVHRPQLQLLPLDDDMADYVTALRVDIAVESGPLRSDLLQQVIPSLNSKELELTMYLLEGLKPSEVALRLHTTPQAACARTHRLLKKLRTMILNLERQL